MLISSNAIRNYQIICKILSSKPSIEYVFVFADVRTGGGKWMKMISKNVRAGFLCVFFGRATSVFSFKRLRGKKETDQKYTCVKSVKIGLTLPNHDSCNSVCKIGLNCTASSHTVMQMFVQVFAQIRARDRERRGWASGRPTSLIALSIYLWRGVAPWLLALKYTDNHISSTCERHLSFFVWKL